MSDWKSALKAVKKELFGATPEIEPPNRGAKTKVSYGAVKPRNQPRSPRSENSEDRVRQARSRFQKSSLPLAEPRAQAKLMEAPKAVAAIAPRPLAITEQALKTEVPLVQPKPPTPAGVPSTFQIQSRKSSTRQASFKLPDAWVSEGCRTQLPAGLDVSGAIDVFIGLDFGTSYTKASVGLKDQVFVVDWQGVSGGADRYLLPSEYSIMADGTCQIGQAPTLPFDQVRQCLKHPLINADVSTASLANAAVFLALVLRYIRAWVFSNHGDKIGRSSIRWMLNIGAPSNGLENEQQRGSYLKMCTSAWSMSTSASGPSAAHACELISAWQPDVLPRDLIGLDVLPEFVAQIAGYVQSAQRQSGLHALVDVGGGTLDVVTFIVHEQDGENVFPFLLPEIRALGTQMLYQNRLVEAPEHEHATLPDELQPVLNCSDYAKCTGLPENHIALRDSIFWREVDATARRVFHRTKHYRNRWSEVWTNGLPVFFTGGGGTVEGYRKSVKSGGQNSAPVMNLMLLPTHPKLAEFSGTPNDYQRVSVACGLAQDAFSIGKLVPAAQLEDDAYAKLPAAKRPDRDELYAR